MAIGQAAAANASNRSQQSQADQGLVLDDAALERLRSLRSGDDWAALLRQAATHREFDVADASADAASPETMAPPGPLTGSGVLPGLWDALGWLARRHGFTVGQATGEAGDSATDWISRRITVSPAADHAGASQLLLHELGHVLLHGTTGHPQDASTTGCRGIRKLEADSVAFVVITRLGMDAGVRSWPFISSWAGSDPRARPEATALATATRVAGAARTIIDHLDVALFGRAPDRPQRLSPSAGVHLRTETVAPVSALPAGQIGRVLADAEQFYLICRDRSWVPRYLAGRGVTPETIQLWRIGYAPAKWTALIDHLHAQGHSHELIQAAGLARRSSRGTLIDHFRDRVMIAIRDKDGTVSGFIGRASPTARPDVPKYLNTPETALYTKGHLLFGLHENRRALAHGAVPVIVEGPFDAIAISAASAGRYAGLAPCGTALTRQQVTALARFTDLGDRLVLVALDADRAGQAAAVKSYRLLSGVTTKLAAVALPAGRDPADVLQLHGPAALASMLQHRSEPLARIVIDAHLDSHAAQLDHAEGQLNALRDAASHVASTLPVEVAQEVVAIMDGQQVMTTDKHMRPIAHPELASIALVLPAGSICQIVRIAERLGVEYSEVTAAVANAVISNASRPASGRPARRSLRDFPHAPHALPKAERGPPTPRPRPAATSRPARRSPR